MNTTQIFLGHWDVVEVQRRRRGEWMHEYYFELGDWTIVFSEAGRRSEIFRPGGIPEETSASDWSFDERSGVIRLHSDDMPPEFVQTSIFVETKGETYRIISTTFPTSVTILRLSSLIMLTNGGDL